MALHCVVGSSATPSWPMCRLSYLLEGRSAGTHARARCRRQRLPQEKRLPGSKSWRPSAMLSRLGASLETQLAGPSEVRGNLEGTGVVSLLRSVRRTRPDARVTLRDAWNLFECEYREGRFAQLTRRRATVASCAGRLLCRSCSALLLALCRHGCSGHFEAFFRGQPR